MHFGQGPVQQKPTKTPCSRIAEKLQCFKTQKEATNLAELRALCKRMESYLKAGAGSRWQLEGSCDVNVVTFSIIFTRFSYPIVALGLDSPCEPVSCHCQGTAVEEHERRMEEAGDTSRPPFL